MIENVLALLLALHAFIDLNVLLFLRRGDLPAEVGDNEKVRRKFRRTR